MLNELILQYMFHRYYNIRIKDTFNATVSQAKMLSEVFVAVMCTVNNVYVEWKCKIFIQKSWVYNT